MGSGDLYFLGGEITPLQWPHQPIVLLRQSIEMGNGSSFQCLSFNLKISLPFSINSH